jgi:hypothetical protein
MAPMLSTWCPHAWGWTVLLGRAGANPGPGWFLPRLSQRERDVIGMSLRVHRRTAILDRTEKEGGGGLHSRCRRRLL